MSDNVEGRHETHASKGNCVDLDVDGKKLSFTRGEDTAGKTLYFIVVTTIIIIVGGAAWTIGDYFQPTGKWEEFLALPWGAKIAIIGVGLFVLFLLIVVFYILYKRGTHSITKALFSAKKVYCEMKTTGLAKVVTGGIMISIFLIAGGMVIFLIELAMSVGTSEGLFAFLTDLTLGELVLTVGIFALGFVSLTIAFAYLWNAGNIALTKRFFPGKKAEK